MRKLKLSLIALAFSLPQSATAQDSPLRVVPVEKAPFHVTAFRNEYVRMLNVHIPPGRTASYHKHQLDVVTVVVGGAKIRAQELGQEAVEPNIPDGAVTYTGYAKKPLIHQVSNIDTKTFWVVGFEITYPEAGRFSPSSRSERPAYKPELDNERVRGWRLVMEPGDSVSAITQQAPGVRIILRGGDLVESGPGYPDQDMNFRPGDFVWQEPGMTRALRNTGTTPVEFVEFELK